MGRDVQLAESELIWIPEHRHLRLGAGNRATARAERKVTDLLDDVVGVITESHGLGVNGIVAALAKLGTPARRTDVVAARDAPVNKV
jgi:hypothetical protein